MILTATIALAITQPSYHCRVMSSVMHNMPNIMYGNWKPITSSKPSYPVKGNLKPNLSHFQVIISIWLQNPHIIHHPLQYLNTFPTNLKNPNTKWLTPNFNPFWNPPDPFTSPPPPVHLPNPNPFTSRNPLMPHPVPLPDLSIWNPFLLNYTNITIRRHCMRIRQHGGDLWNIRKILLMQHSSFEKQSSHNSVSTHVRNKKMCFVEMSFRQNLRPCKTYSVMICPSLWERVLIFL